MPSAPTPLGATRAQPGGPKAGSEYGHAQYPGHCTKGSHLGENCNSSIDNINNLDSLPSLCIDDGRESTKSMNGRAEGKEEEDEEEEEGSKDRQEYHWLGAVTVHVKDVAKAQVLLFETPASGTYLCTNGIYQLADFAHQVSILFPQYRFNGETQPGLTACRGAAKRLIDLGLAFIPVEDAVQDTVESIKAKGFLNQKMPQS
ncbi:hypothetical protein CMV_015521 [Castanea mollissima]|uniref:Uncharacterized protein n=1 Tax=Castanea mollissima TaxID=60419 RepID=A0A8J4QVD4_9ROSI|nr:hypothetical protein CMV_015521 [Castanea mollissima]